MGLDCRCLVLAAGKGTRLLPVTQHVPKPLFPILDTPALSTVLHKLRSEGFCKIAINSHHLATNMEKWHKQSPAAVDTLLIKEKVLLDTGGAVKNAFNVMGWDKPILVYNGDIISNVSVSKFVGLFHRNLDASALFCLHDNPRYNKVACIDSRITSFNSEGEKCLAYTGIAIFGPECFTNAPSGPFPLIPYMEDLIEKGMHIAACRAEEITVDDQHWFWHDIGTPCGYLSANFSLLGLKGLGTHMEDCTMGESVQIRKNVIIGKGAKIQGLLELENVVIWPATELCLNGKVSESIFTPFGNLHCNNQS